MKMKPVYCLCVILLFSFAGTDYEVGQRIDVHNGVAIYYNGNSTNVHGRHLSSDGYNFGLKWQCVEFVKRYYYQKFGHRMPSSYGHAKDFYDKSLGDQGFNSTRGLMQFRNTRYEKPREDDILIYDAMPDNGFGHMGIISCVTDTEIELVQQNWGSKSRVKIKLAEYEGIYTVADFHILGWLRKVN